jgi:hypothetical protein
MAVAVTRVKRVLGTGIVFLQNCCTQVPPPIRAVQGGSIIFHIDLTVFSRRYDRSQAIRRLSVAKTIHSVAHSSNIKKLRPLQ